MDAQVRKVNNVTIVSITGRLDIDRSLLFRKNCLPQLIGQKLAFALEGLQFVGSTGIQSFFKSIMDLAVAKNTHVKVVGLHRDFKRLFTETEWESVHFCETLDLALESFDNPQSWLEQKAAAPQAIRASEVTTVIAQTDSSTGGDQGEGECSTRGGFESAVSE